MLNWLHLTDLHWGLSGQPTLFPNLKGKFFDDLEILLEKCDPWDLIFFTGDLVQSGKREEFETLEAAFFGDLRKFFLNRLGYEPVMLAVPGNHDLDRKALERFPATMRVLARSQRNSQDCRSIVCLARARMRIRIQARRRRGV